MELEETKKIRTIRAKNIGFFLPSFGSLGVFAGSFSLFGILWLTSKGISVQFAGLLGGISTVVSVFFLNNIGNYSDKTGERKRAILSLAVIASLLIIILTEVSSIMAIYILWVLILCTYYTIIPLLDGLAVRLVPIEKGKIINFTWFRTSMSIGYSITIVSVGYLFDVMGIAILPYVGFTCFAIVVLVGVLLDDSKIGRYVSEKSLQQETTQLQKSKKKKEGNSWLALLAIPWIKMFLFINLIYGVGFSFYAGYLILHLNSLGFSNMDAGLIIIWGNFAEIAMFILAKHFVLKFRAITLLAFCSLVACVRWFFFGQLVDFYALSALSLLHGITFGLHHVVCSYFLQRNVPEELSSSAQGMLQTSLINIPYGLGFPLGGLLYASIGSELFTIGAFFPMVAFLLTVYLLFRKPPGKSQKKLHIP